MSSVSAREVRTCHVGQHSARGQVVVMMEDRSAEELHDLLSGDVIVVRDHRPDHNDDILTERKYFD